MIRLPGSHVPNIKNRSSKHLFWLTKLRPIVRCLNNEQLNKLVGKTSLNVNAEIERRKKRQLKKASKTN
jgi:hypothetical protein